MTQTSTHEYAYYMARPDTVSAKGVAIGLAAFSFPVLSAFAIYSPIIRYASLALVAIVIFLQWARLARPLKLPHFVFSLFSVCAIVLATYLSTSSIAAEKPTNFIIVALMFGLGLSVLYFDQQVIQSLHITFFILGCLMLLSLVIAPAHYQSERISLGSNNPIWVARNVGLAALGIFMFWLRSNKASTIPLLIVIACLGAIVMTGSRGPLIAATAAMSVGVLLSKSSNKWFKITLLSITAILALLFILQSSSLGNTRGLNILNPQDASAESRFAMYRFTASEILTTPWGIGIGNFEFYPHVYPHNIFLEFLIEWGWIAGSLAILSILIGSIAIFRLPPTWHFLRLVLVYELINASLSGDVTSPRFLYSICFFGLFLTVYRLWHKTAGGQSPQAQHHAYS